MYNMLTVLLGMVVKLTFNPALTTNNWLYSSFWAPPLSRGSLWLFWSTLPHLVRDTLPPTLEHCLYLLGTRHWHKCYSILTVQRLQHNNIVSLQVWLTHDWSHRCHSDVRAFCVPAGEHKPGKVKTANGWLGMTLNCCTHLFHFSYSRTRLRMLIPVPLQQIEPGWPVELSLPADT